MKNRISDMIVTPAAAARLHDRVTSFLKSVGSFAPVFALALVATVIADPAFAGTSAVFDDLATESEAAIFGPLGQSVVFVAALAGAIIATLKGAWLFAAMGVAVAGLMYASQIVAGASTFSALLPVAGV